MVWPGFVIFVPYINQRFASVRRMLFDRRDKCVPGPGQCCQLRGFPAELG